MMKEKHITRYGQEQGQGYTFKGWMLVELSADGADSHEIFNRYRRLGNEC